MFHVGSDAQVVDRFAAHVVQPANVALAVAPAAQARRHLGAVDDAVKHLHAKGAQPLAKGGLDAVNAHAGHAYQHKRFALDGNIDVPVAEKALDKTDRACVDRAKEKGISKIVFDRGGYKYIGRVKALAEGAREGGLEF